MTSRVTLIGPVFPYRGGIAHFNTILAQKLNELGHQVQVLSFSRQYPAFLYPGKTDKDPSLEPLSVQAQYSLDPIFPWTWWKTARSIWQYSPEVVFIEWWSTFWAPAYFILTAMLRKWGIPVVYIIHNVMPHEPWPWDRWLAQLTLARAKSFLVLSPGERERLLVLLPNSVIITGELPLYDSFANHSISQATARKKLNLPAQGSVVLFFGIVRPYKGLRYLLEAIAIVKQRGTDVHLLVTGEFWEKRTFYDEYIRQLGIDDEVHIDARYIPNEELGAYFSAADIFAAPYVEGTQSAAVKMAISFGLPVVVTPVVSEGMSTSDPARTRVVPPADPQALASAIIDLLTHPVLVAQDVAQQSRASWQRLIDGLLSVI